MRGLLDHYGMWTAERSFTLLVCVVAAVAMVLLLIVSGTALRWRLRASQWQRRASLQATEIAALRDALAHARYRVDVRPRPAAVGEWVVAAARPKKHRHWTAALGWPGTTGADVPFPYGTHLEAPLVDPCLAEPPDDDTLAAWLTEPQAQSWPPLTVGELLVEQALTEFEQAALTDDTRELEVA